MKPTMVAAYARWSFYSVTLVLYLSATVDADCYSHDGVAALNSQYYRGDELVSCGNGTNNCCLKDDKCGSNLLCVDSKNGFARQYCADPSWKGCSTVCPGGMAAGVSIKQCGPNVYCCGDCDCKSSLYFVDPLNGEVKDASKASATNSPTWWTVDSTALLRSSSSTSAASSSLPPPPSPTTTTASRSPAAAAAPQSSSSQPAGPSPSQPFQSSSSSQGAPPPSSPATSSSTPTRSSRLSAGAGAGIGIGAAAAVALISVLIWFLMKQRRNSPHQEPPADSKGPVGMQQLPFHPPPGYTSNPHGIQGQEVTRGPEYEIDGVNRVSQNTRYWGGGEQYRSPQSPHAFRGGPESQELVGGTPPFRHEM